MDENGAREVLQTPRLDALWQIVSEGGKKWFDVALKDRANLSSRSRASMISDYISAEAIKALTGADGAEIAMKYGQVRILIDGKLRIHFKKLNHRLRPSCVPTDRAQAILGQLEDQLEGMPLPLPEPPTTVIVGYRWNVLETAFGIYAICPNVKRNEWAFEIEEPGQGRAAAAPTPLAPPSAPQTGRSVRPKKKKDNVVKIVDYKRSG